MDLRELICDVFANPNLTMRNRPEVSAVKKCLAEMGYADSSELTVLPPQIANLTEDQKQFLDNNHQSSSPLELLRTVFHDESLALTAPEGRAILAYLKEIAPQLYNRNDEPVDELEYKAPRNLKEMIARINRLVPNPVDYGSPLYVHGEMNAQQTKNLSFLLAQVNIPRFVHTASQFLKKVDRELFESSFLRQLHDNTDLTPQDVDQYIAYCESIVNAAQTARTIQQLQVQVDDEFQTKGRTSESLVEHIKTLNASLQAEKMRQTQLYKTLGGERSKRLNDLTQASISMHPLVEKWRTKEGRDRLLKGAAIKRDALGKEVTRLTEMEALRCEIWGISTTEILK